MRYRKAIFAIVYAKTEKGIEYLILKRKLHWKGWEFVKGKIEFLETKIKTVKREVFEETGLKPVREKGKRKIRRFNFSGRYKWKKSLKDRSEFIGQTFSLYSVEVKKPEKKKIKISKKEHSDYQWVNFEKALKKFTWPNQRKSLKIVNEWLKKELHQRG